MPLSVVFRTSALAGAFALLGCAGAQPTPAPRPAGAAATPNAAAGGQRRAPRPYAQVITRQAVTDTGGITVHQVEDRWFFEVPDSLARRDFLLVTRIAGVPANFGGFLSAGTSVEERVVRWERQGDRVLLRSISYDQVADDSLPIAQSVVSNNLPQILASFPVQAYTSDSASAVVDVTEFFAGDTPGIAGLNAAQRRQYQVRRLDPARSFVNTIRAYPLNVEVRHTQTFEAGEPPGDRSSGALSLEMRQSIVLLPATPMRPRYADPRAGFFSVTRVNYGLDEQKAATESFIRRWRLEPKDPAAYARGELVEPVKPIVYYLDPATPAQWRPFVRQGVEDWQPVFEAAGFRNAIVAREPPSPAEDPEWDPEDIRYSVVRWAASTTRNAVGPSTSDPRSGEIIESDITWYHNHMRSYRNRLMIETGAANPDVRSLNIPTALMGQTMRQVIAHEVGHALGLPHNMVASNSFPVDSLRSPSFVRQYGVSATIMDYARQNYVAQPGDGLVGNDFIRRLGPFDDFIINWGYRVLPQAATAEAERPILDRWLAEQSGPMAYRYLPQYLAGIDPRSQTEDVGDDPILAGTYAIANLKRVVPNLASWTATAGQDDTDLQELYGETVGMWSTYMRHAIAVIGGVHVDQKTTDQSGPVYQAVPAAQQRRALRFLAEQAIQTPEWLAPDAILTRIGPATSVASAQSNVVAQLLDARRLDRIAAAERLGAADPYPLAAYLGDLRGALLGNGAALRAPDANRRTLHRVYLERLAALATPPEPSAAGGGGGGGGAPSPLLAPPNVQRSDLPALARSELVAIREAARRAAPAAADALTRAHWLDVVARVDRTLDVSNGG